jgi:hypothetical protein
VRLTRRLFFTERVKLDLIIESFNLLNRDKSACRSLRMVWNLTLHTS